MRKLIDLTGQVFGQLTVIERAPNIGKQPAWRCKCSCGNECVVQAGALKSGQKTCGCGQHPQKHGMCHTKIYDIWSSMMQRCYNPNNKEYPDYGGRGIRVCECWHKFENFYEDVSAMEHFGEKGYSLDRIENDKDYCPENVRWADRKTQNRNRRDNVFVEYEGVQMCLKEAAEKAGIYYQTLHSRYQRGDRGKRLFRTVKLCAH